MGIVAEQVRRQTTTRLDKIIVEVALEDVAETLRLVAAEAIGEQIALGNPPTSILVDNHSSKDIRTASKRIQAFFADVSMVYQAVQDAWAMTIDLTRSRTGTARASYELWFKEQKIGNSPDAARGYLERFNPATDYFRIVGPVLVYGRKVYWNPVGTPKFQKRTALRTKTAIFKIVRIRGIMNLVEASMRRKFRSIAVAEDWVITNALPFDGRTPGLWIGFKKRGSLVHTGVISG
jgi:hypothetical protein